MEYSLDQSKKIIRPSLFADSFSITVLGGSVSIEAQKLKYHPFNKTSSALEIQESTEVMTSPNGLINLRERIEEIFENMPELERAYQERLLTKERKKGK